MSKYHKIQSLWHRDKETNFKTFIKDKWSRPEFSYLEDSLWLCDEKVDGTNIRISYDPVDGLNIAGRTDRAEIPKGLMKWYANVSYSIGPKMQELFDKPVCLYGEGYGGKIQKGGKYRKDESFVLFDINVGGVWLTRVDVVNIGKHLDIPPVHSLGFMYLSQAITMCEKGFKSFYGDFEAEGIVARPLVELSDRMGKRIITKIKTKDFR